MTMRQYLKIEKEAYRVQSMKTATSADIRAAWEKVDNAWRKLQAKKKGK